MPAKSPSINEAATEPPDGAPGAMPITTSASYAARSAALPALSAFDRFACAVTREAGSPTAFCAAWLTVLAWSVTGPLAANKNASHRMIGIADLDEQDLRELAERAKMAGNRKEPHSIDEEGLPALPARPDEPLTAT